MAKRKQIAKVTYAKCEVFSSASMACPLCGVMTTPNEWHKCSKPE